MAIRADQLDTAASDFEGTGTDNRQLSIKAGGVTEAKLGFSWETVDVLASAFSYDGTRSTYTLTTAASANGNVLDNSELLRNGVGGMDRVAVTAVSGQWSLSGTTLSVHGDITATGDGYTLRYVVGAASGAASSSGSLIWLGTLPQSPLHAKSDYFEGSSLDPKWTEWDENSSTTVVVEGGEVLITQATSPGITWTGIFQTAPTDDQFCITARLRFSSLFNASVGAAIFVGEDLGAAPATANFAQTELIYAAGSALLASEGFAQYNAGGASFSETRGIHEGVGYVRIYVDRTGGGSIRSLYSLDGRTWASFGTRTYAAAGPLADVNTIGISADNLNSGEDIRVYCDMFRVDITTDPYLPVGGYVGATAANAPAPNVTLVGTDTDNGNTSLSLTVPAGTQEGDLVIVTMVTRNTTPSTEPGGGGAAWTTLHRFDVDGGEFCCYWYKIAGPSEPATYTLTVGPPPGTATTCAAILTVYRGVNTLVRTTLTERTLVTPGYPVDAGEFVSVAWYSTFASGASQSLPSGLTGKVTEDAAVVNANDQALTVISSRIGFTGSYYQITPDGGTTDFRRATVFASFQ